MEVNPIILETLEANKIRKEDGMVFLLALHFGYQTSTLFPTVFKMKMNTLGIYQALPDGTGISWKVPLFKGQEVAFEWVKTEYVPLFKAKNPTKGGHVREAIARMKKLFADNPEIRKEQILGATRMYLLNTDANYIRLPHYFIDKGKGVDRTNDILDWVDKYLLSQKDESVGRVSKTNTMQ